jgi:hypothetical protein
MGNDPMSYYAKSRGNSGPANQFSQGKHDLVPTSTKSYSAVVGSIANCIDDFDSNEHESCGRDGDGPQDWFSAGDFC